MFSTSLMGMVASRGWERIDECFPRTIPKEARVDCLLVQLQQSGGSEGLSTDGNTEHRVELPLGVACERAPVSMWRSGLVGDARGIIVLRLSVRCGDSFWSGEVRRHGPTERSWRTRSSNGDRCMWFAGKRAIELERWPTMPSQ